ncbi:MAG: hypothetical protein K0S00_4581 [Xanthobacteraceae bacterium]|jgi:hypothetical protein|nr:hypothetical protein [Xanthobacteraceae bacterium]
MPNGLGRWRVAGYRMGSVTLALAACVAACVAAGEALRTAGEALRAAARRLGCRVPVELGCRPGRKAGRLVRLQLGDEA